MKIISQPACFLLAASLAAALITPCDAARNEPIPKPDFTKGDPIPAVAPHDWNLGATGCRGWMFSDKRSTAVARQIRITMVAKGSPADPSYKEIANRLTDEKDRMRRLFPKQAATIRKTILDTLPELEAL